MNMPVTLDAVHARALTDRIKVAVDGTWLLIQEAYTSRAWTSLGYASWDDYCTREFGTSRLRLPREERQEVVASLREIGMSVRAIGAATGDHYSTVSRELGRVADATPAAVPVLNEMDEGENAVPTKLAADGHDASSPTQPIVGTDGKTYSPTAKPGTGRPRAPLPQQFLTIAHELTRLTSRLERLQGDDRFPTNRSSIQGQCSPELSRAHEVIGKFLAALA